MVQNGRGGFNPHGVNNVFYNLAIMYWTLDSIYMQFEYRCPKSSNAAVEHVQLLRGMFGFFEPREMLRSFAARGIYCLKLVCLVLKRVHAPRRELKV